MMDTSMSQEYICSLVKDGILVLETIADSKPNYNGVVVIEGMLLVTEYHKYNLQFYRRRDGTFLSSHRLESHPRGVCLISNKEVAVCLKNSIVIMSFKNIDDVKLVNTFDVSRGFYSCHSVAKLNSCNLLVSGGNYERMLCWGVVSITNGRLYSTEIICKGIRTHLAIKDKTVYISCWTSDSTTIGVYAYDIFNPHRHMFLYQHKELKIPGSIIADRGSIFVIDEDSKRIHQLTDSGQLVAIHTVSSSPYVLFYDDQQGVLYTTSYISNVITLYKMKYLHQPEKLVIRTESISCLTETDYSWCAGLGLQDPSAQEPERSSQTSATQKSNICLLM